MTSSCMTIFPSMVQVIICAIVDQYLIALYWNMIIKRMCMWLGFSMHHIPACMTYVIHFKYRQSIQHHTHHLKTLHLIPSSSRWIKAKKRRNSMGLLPDTQNCGCACAGNAGNVFPATAGKRSRHASRHVRHARAVMHAGIANLRYPLKSAAGENVPGIPGACATCNFTYLVRGPLVTHWRWSCVFLARAHGINDERHLYSQFHSQSDKIWLPVSPLAAMPEYMTTECQFWQSHAKTDHSKSVTGKINPLD